MPQAPVHAAGNPDADVATARRPGGWGFIEEFRATAPVDVLARQVELMHAWRRFPAIDPVPPRELLPARWSGLKAARLASDRAQMLQRNVA